MARAMQTAELDKEGAMHIAKRGFALVAVLAASGMGTSILPACGGGGSEATVPNEAGPDVHPPPPLPPDPPEPPDACVPNACPPCNQPAITAADLDSAVGYKSAVAQTGACTSGEITQLDNNANDPSTKSYADLGKGLSVACKACVIANDTDSHWAPVVATAKDMGQTGFYDFGACFGAVEGDACGKAVQYSQFCFDSVCTCAGTDQNARAACVKKAAAKGGACATLNDAVVSACPKIQDTQTTCGDILDAARFLCSSPSDAGGG